MFDGPAPSGLNRHSARALGNRGNGKFRMLTSEVGSRLSNQHKGISLGVLALPK